MKTPHKHAELIKAWAEGAVLQKRYICGSIGEIYLWEIFDGDWSYCADYEFRIKPEKKPDVVRYLMTNDEECGNLKLYEDRLFVRPQSDEYDNLFEQVKLIYDGETGKLKYSEVLK